jgi:hemolysin III
MREGVLVGVLFRLVWLDAPRWLCAVAYVAVGSVAVATFPQLAVGIGFGGVTLFALGGVLYTVGVASAAPAAASVWIGW